jgi:hypothetical protein
MRSDLAYFNLEQKALRPVRHQVVTDAVAPRLAMSLGRISQKFAEREGFSAKVPRTSETAVKSAFPDNRGGLRTTNMSGNRWLGLS